MKQLLLVLGLFAMGFAQAQPAKPNDAWKKSIAQQRQKSMT